MVTFDETIVLTIQDVAAGKVKQNNASIWLPTESQQKLCSGYGLEKNCSGYGFPKKSKQRQFYDMACNLGEFR